jgi:hypothetical protein
MNSAKIAESVLSSTMEPTEAAIVIGDLLEAGASRSAIWFWSNVFQTWAATVWRGFRTRPRFVLGLAVRGALWQWSFCLLVGGAYMFAIAFACLMVSLPHPELFQEFRSGTFFVVHPAFFVPFDLVPCLAAPFYVGQKIARRAFGLEVPVCITMAIAYLCLCELLFLFFVLLHRHSSIFGHKLERPYVLDLYLIPILLWASSLTGALLVRRRMQAMGAAQ